MRLYDKDVKEVVVSKSDFLRILRHAFPEISPDARVRIVDVDDSFISIEWTEITKEQELEIEDIED